ncbi:MAG: hypothetical protein AB1486_17220 [Planctomycetota bacterium]
MSPPTFDEILEEPKASPSEVLRVAFAHLRQLLAAQLSAKREFLEDDVGRLVQARAAFGGVVNLANGLCLALESGGLEAAARWLEGFGRELEAARTRIGQLGAALVPPSARVVTVSRSTTVQALLKSAAQFGMRARLTCAAGLPVGEGLAMAAQMAAQGLRVEVYADAALLARVSEADLVLVGGVALTPNGLLARTGTRALLQAAREARVLAYAVMAADGVVGAPLAGDVRPARVPRVDLWPDPPPGVTVRNAMLEWCPVALLSGMLTESGAVDAAGLVTARAATPRAAAFPDVEGGA